MARKPQDDPKLDMTPMIDVVFELIIFFVVTIKQEDIFSRLNVNRPAPANSSSDSPANDDNIEVHIGPNGVVKFKNAVVNLENLSESLRKVAQANKDTPIIVKCTANSFHQTLVNVLDICYQHKLYSVSVFTF